MRLTRLVREYRPPSENDWAFGQVLPLVMTAAPVILLASPLTSLYRARRRWRSRADEGHALEAMQGDHVCVLTYVQEERQQ